jgi:hypothetical protein
MGEERRGTIRERCNKKEDHAVKRDRSEGDEKAERGEKKK